MSHLIQLKDPVTRKQLADLKRKLKLADDSIIALAIAKLWLADGKDAKA
jgi:hypothetical protein